MEGEKAVNLRAKTIQGEYKRKAKAMDVELGVGHEEQGPTVQRLNQFPPVLDLVFGAYSEASNGVWELMDKMIDSRLKMLGLARGSPAVANEVSIITSQLRRRLSSAVMKANINCLLERMCQVGEGVAQAGRRREWVRMEEEKMRWDRQSQWLARVTGNSLIRRGQFLNI